MHNFAFRAVEQCLANKEANLCDLQSAEAMLCCTLVLQLVLDEICMSMRCKAGWQHRPRPIIAVYLTAEPKCHDCTSVNCAEATINHHSPAAASITAHPYNRYPLPPHIHASFLVATAVPVSAGIYYPYYLLRSPLSCWSLIWITECLLTVILLCIKWFCILF